ncbi:MAG: LamG-like jellyroll fold domain-containing protein [Planctomycetota bacterium]
MTTLRHLDFNPPGFGELNAIPPRPDAYRQAVFALRPSAYWPLEDAPGSTTFADAQRGTHNASFTNATLGQPGPLAHDATTTAVAFANGFAQAPSFANFATLLPNGFTVATWVRTTTSNQGGIAGVANDANQTALLIQLNTNLSGRPSPNRVRCFLRDNASLTLRADTQIPTFFDDAWHHLAVTYNPATGAIIFYLDGQPQPTSQNTTTPIGTTSAFEYPWTLAALARDPTVSSTLAGSLAHLAVFDRTLPAQQITSLYAAAVDDIAVTLTQSATAAHPDAPTPPLGATPLGLSGALQQGSVGRVIDALLASAEPVLHARFVVRHDEFNFGAATLARLIDPAGRPVAWVSLSTALSPNDPPTITLHTATADAAPVTLAANLPWTSVELATNATSQTATLHIDGRLAATAPIPADDIARVELGIAAPTSAVGSIALDDLVLTNQTVGPLARDPQRNDAADPARWLVVYRQDQPDSAAFAAAYRNARHIPYANLLGLTAPDEETITPAQEADLRQQIADYLAHANLASTVVGVLLAPGVPGLVDLVGNGSILWPTASSIETDQTPISETPNPFATHPLARPTAPLPSNLLMVARIDGPPELTLDLIDRATQRIAAPLTDQPAPRAFIDPFGTPSQDGPHTTATANWPATINAIRTHLPITATSDVDRALPTLADDALVFAFEPGPAAPSRFAESIHRTALINASTVPPTTSSLRTNPTLNWAGAATAAGYSVAIAATAQYSASVAPSLDRFAAALLAGWTLAEAFFVSRPSLGTPFHFIGDPLTTVRFPPAATRVTGLAGSTLDALAAPLVAELPASTTATPVPATLAQQDDRVVVAIQPLDADDQPSAAATTAQLIRHNGMWQPAPALPAWPRAIDWPVRQTQGRPRPLAIWERPLRELGLSRVTLESRTDQTVQTRAEFDATTTPHPLIELEADTPLAATQYRWRVVGPSGASTATPWSAAVGPASAIDQPAPLVEDWP